MRGRQKLFDDGRTAHDERRRQEEAREFLVDDGDDDELLSAIVLSVGINCSFRLACISC
jgi:hypothetical protein